MVLRTRFSAFRHSLPLCYNKWTEYSKKPTFCIFNEMKVIWVWNDIWVKGWFPYWVVCAEGMM